jgi:hypothetical protein
MDNKATYVPQVGGTHYQSDYQVWDYSADVHLDPYRFNAVKYLQRAGQKPEVSELRDVMAALSYMKKLAVLLKMSDHCSRGSFFSMWAGVGSILSKEEKTPFTDKFADSNKVKPVYFSIIVDIVNVIDKDTRILDFYNRLEEIEKRLEACVASLQEAYK